MTLFIEGADLAVGDPVRGPDDEPAVQVELEADGCSVGTNNW